MREKSFKIQHNFTIDIYKNYNRNIKQERQFLLPQVDISILALSVLFWRTDGKWRSTCFQELDLNVGTIQVSEVMSCVNSCSLFESCKGIGKICIHQLFLLTFFNSIYIGMHHVRL